MRAPYLLILLIHTFSLFWVACCGNPEVVLPKNIVQQHIENIADFTVDPCDDFYAHVCPQTKARDNFFNSMFQTKERIVEEYEKNHSEDELVNAFTQDKTIQLKDTIESFINSEESSKLCLINEKLVTVFSRHILTFTSNDNGSLEQWKSSSCEGKLAILRRSPDVAAKFIQYRSMIMQAIHGSIANSQMENLDKKLRKLFPKLKLAVQKALRKTPWARKYGALELYEDALQKINFTTYADLRKNLHVARKEFVETKQECLKMLNGKFSEEIQQAICEVIAVGEGVRYITKPMEEIYAQDLNDVLSDRVQAWNSFDDHVYFSNDFLLLANTDYISDLYGSIGFSITHEILHTLVFGDTDAQKPLAAYWTKDAGCVEEQTRKTCETFPTVECGSARTLEEDAADIAAYRIVWDVYQKAYIRKTPVENYESLDKKQLFFYGAAVVFCTPGGMSSNPYYQEKHSNNYQRVNSLMSQMDQFADAFKCKPTDRMVMNKARNCELYGSKAMVRRRQG